MGYGVVGVDCEVDDDLFDLVLVGFDGDGLVGEENVEVNVFVEE